MTMPCCLLKCVNGQIAVSQRAVNRGSQAQTPQQSRILPSRGLGNDSAERTTDLKLGSARYATPPSLPRLGRPRGRKLTGVPTKHARGCRHAGAESESKASSYTFIPRTGVDFKATCNEKTYGSALSLTPAGRGSSSTATGIVNS